MKEKERPATAFDIGKEVYVDGIPQDTFRLVTSYYEDDDQNKKTPFGVVRNGYHRFVYKLSDLRVKE